MTEAMTWGDARDGFANAIAATSDDDTKGSVETQGENSGKDNPGDDKPGETQAGTDDTPSTDGDGDKTQQAAGKDKTDDDSDVTGEPGSRAEKRIRQLVSARNKATGELDTQSAQLKTALAEIETLKAGAAAPSTDSFESTGDAELDALLKDLDKENAENAETAPSEVQTQLDEQKAQLTTLLVATETKKLEVELAAAEAAYPNLPDLRALLIHSVQKDANADIMRVSEDYAQHVAKIRGVDTKGGEAAGNTGTKAPPRINGKGTSHSRGSSSEKPKPKTWADAKAGFMDAISR